jgi:hypothetical protein
MARKRKEDSDSKYDVLIGFVHDFSYHNGQTNEDMNGHPVVGRVYRLIKDPNGFRLHIGRENNTIGLDGLFLGPALEAIRPDFSFKIEPVTPANFLTLPINEEDATSIAKWVADENKDLWARIKLEETGEVPVVKSVKELMALLATARSEGTASTPAPIVYVPKMGYKAIIQVEVTAKDLESFLKDVSSLGFKYNLNHFNLIKNDE